MSAVQLTEPLDKLSEKQMAEYLGTTPRALEAKRARKQIPEGVWKKIGSRIFYSIRRYNEWQESLWHCPPELKLGAMPSASGSVGIVSAAQKPSRTPPRKRASTLHPVYAIK
ncbi:hypothetical protein [Phytopseudomonas argentinensis]|uniref:hypothetical protein n=1 Tax=Phytopseudomonas argentinensis TaxID=289370 RepID=UPI001FC953AF|nr:hypothetical protein [Pseudomonas argentinensis]